MNDTRPDPSNNRVKHVHRPVACIRNGITIVDASPSSIVLPSVATPMTRAPGRDSDQYIKFSNLSPHPPHEISSQPPDNSADVVPTTACFFPNLMSRILEVLPPPDLSYPPDELDLDPLNLTRETGGTRLENDRLINPLVPERERAAFFIIVDRLISEQDGHRVCTVCGGTVGALRFVRSDDFRVLLNHLQQAHPLSSG